VRGGWRGGWDAPTLIREVDGALSVGWIAAGTDWIGEAVVTGETAFAVETRARAGLVHLALADGSVLWRTPLPPWLALEGVFYDDSQVYVAMQVYDEHAPTPRVAVPMRVAAFERATGRAGWTVDFPEHPGGVVASRGTVVAAVGGELRFIEGSSGEVLRRVAMGPPNIYPRMRVVGERVIVALHGAPSAVTSFDVSSGARQWSTELPLDGGPELAAHGDMVFVTTAGLSVAALDVNSGAVRWDMGVGVDGHRLYAGAAAVVVAGSGAAGGFALPVTGEAEEATVRGRVVEVECGTLADAAVQVGGTGVRVAADGTFAAEIRARGVVVVRGAGSLGMGRRDGGEPLRASASVRLDGSGDYVVPDLTLSRCERE
jgi:outer membrane protein assembly factor BamB